MTEKEREWAVGLSQTDFEREYQKKFPMGDVLPSVESYLKPILVEERGISPFMIGEGEEEDGKVKLPGTDKQSNPADNTVRNNRRNNRHRTL